MTASELLRELDKTLDQALTRGLGAQGLTPPPGCKTAPKAVELVAFCERLQSFFDQLNEAYAFAEALANGDLKAGVQRGNVFAMPLKSLQASLLHLTWQANQVAAGDLNQQVQFLGEFSRAFNHMIQSLREKAILERRVQTISDVLGEGVLLVDAGGNILFANPEAERLLGYGQQELKEKPFHLLFHLQQPNGRVFSPAESPLFAAVRDGRGYDDEDLAFTCKSGQMLSVAAVCRPVPEDHDQGSAVIAFRDITEHKKHLDSLKLINDLLEKQATTDGLTGIFNRRKIIDQLRIEIDRSRRYGGDLSVIMFDIDHFKQVNDTFGHLQGDKVLREIATLVKANLRSTDSFGRWGGEEFLVIAGGVALSQALRLAEKLRALIAAHRFAIGHQVTSSFGVAFLLGTDNENSFTNRADQCLYRAKDEGRNRVVGAEH